jgi:hypothetical protein
MNYQEELAKLGLLNGLCRILDSEATWPIGLPPLFVFLGLNVLPLRMMHSIDLCIRRVLSVLSPDIVSMWNENSFPRHLGEKISGEVERISFKKRKKSKGFEGELNEANVNAEATLCMMPLKDIQGWSSYSLKLALFEWTDMSVNNATQNRFSAQSVYSKRPLTKTAALIPTSRSNAHWRT